MAKKLGITSAWYSPDFHTCSGTYALGVVDVSPLDMASAYGVFDNHGARAEPTPILKILDSSNHVIVDNIATRPATSQVIAPAVADNVTDVLRGVIQYGTGVSANIGRPAAGKTGTTSNFTNGWFVGYTPTLSTAVWMGYANNESTPLRNIRGVSAVFGGTIPAQTWASFMSQALANVPPTDFSQAPPIQPPPTVPITEPRPTIGPGPERYQGGTGAGGPYVYGPPRLHAPPRPPPTVTTSTSSSTTSTTASSTTSSSSSVP
jgi:penicillin-binding protein 1A